MSTESTPTVATLSEVRDGDLHIYQRSDGAWSAPRIHIAHDPGAHGRLPAVILERARPWPNSPLIYIRAARCGDKPLDGLPAVANRDSSGDYKVDGGAYISRMRKGDFIDDYDPIVSLTSTVLSRLLAVVDVDAVHGKTGEAYQAARVALVEAVGE